MSNTANNFMKLHQLGFRVERVSTRPDSLGDWQRDARHWRFEFRTLSNDEVFAGYFSQGSAHSTEPTAAEVLEACTMDARSFDDAADVLDFAHEFGYDLDMTEGVDRVRKVYAGCGESFAGLSALLGDNLAELFCLDFDEE